MGGRIPRRPPNGPGTFCFSMSLRRWLTGGEITISVGKSKPSLSSSLCDELLFMSVARWDWNIPNKGFPLQRMEAAAAHVEAPHHFNSSHTVPFIHWLWWYVSSLDWRNGTNSSHISRSGKQIVFHDFPGEFCIFFFCRTLEIKNFQVLLSWPLSLSLSPRCHSSSSVWFCNWTERSSRLFTPPLPPVLHQPAAGSMSAAAAL